MEHRSLIHFWSVLDVLVLAATLASALALCRLGAIVRPKLVVLPLFGLYEAAISVLLFAIALQPTPNHGYFLSYWYSAIGENVMLCLLAIELTCALLPRKQLAMAWCSALAVLMVLSVGVSLPARTEAKLMNATMAGDFVSGLVLMALLYAPGIRISRPYQLIIAGVLVTAGIHALGTFKWMHGELATFTAAALPLSSLAGLVLMLAASVIARRKQISDARNKSGADHSAPMPPTLSFGQTFGTALSGNASIGNATHVTKDSLIEQVPRPHRHGVGCFTRASVARGNQVPLVTLAE